jgi:hypothetical protein
MNNQIQPTSPQRTKPQNPKETPKAAHKTIQQNPKGNKLKPENKRLKNFTII